ADGRVFCGSPPFPRQTTRQRPNTTNSYHALGSAASRARRPAGSPRRDGRVGRRPGGESAASWPAGLFNPDASYVHEGECGLSKRVRVLSGTSVGEVACAAGAGAWPIVRSIDGTRLASYRNAPSFRDFTLSSLPRQRGKDDKVPG